MEYCRLLACPDAHRSVFFSPFAALGRGIGPESDALKRKKPQASWGETAASASYETSANQCVECAARRRILFRKAVVRGAI
jgi:hypothetical protein